MAFELIEPTPDLDVVLVAPRMIGVGVREPISAGTRLPELRRRAPRRDRHGARGAHARDRQGIGSTRAGCIEMSMHDEASLDLFTEQGFGPAFGRVLMSAIELLVEAGYPPEAVLLELYLSGEFAYSLEKIRQVGMLRQMDFHSRTSQYGSITRGARYLVARRGAQAEDGRDPRRDPLGSLRAGMDASAGQGRGAVRQGAAGAREAAPHAMGGSSPRGLRDRRRRGRGRLTPELPISPWRRGLCLARFATFATMAQAIASERRALPQRLVLYDGVCAFCDGAVQWLLAHDPAGRLDFAPLQGETAAGLRRLHPEIPTDLDTIVYVESAAGSSRVFLRAEAIWRTCAELSGPWRRLAWLRWLPRALSDVCYRAFARNRYRWFGRLDVCRIPDAAQRQRFHV